ncbi:MAG: hypothetical protein L0I29_05630 [Hyphomicrobiales bacterium]|nr:hypothetical protein [Hyphomicrobiales bacterium]
MAAYALADMLADFGKRPQQPPPAMPHGSEGPFEGGVRAKPGNPEPDMEALLAQERARTEKTVTERLVAEHEAALAALLETHAARIAEIERRHGEEAGARIEAGLGEIEARVGEIVTGTVARILGPIVGQEVVKRSIDELAGAIGEALEDADAVTIRVSGPSSLFAALAEKLGEKSKHLRHRETDGIDLTVDVNGSLIETRLTEWQVAANEVLG